MLRSELKVGPMTLLYAAKDIKHSHAVALQEYLSK